MASGISFLTNPTEPGNIFKGITKTSLSALTINRYITYMQETFMLSKENRRNPPDGKHHLQRATLSRNNVDDCVADIRIIRR